jgi:hypothetical protein
MPQKKKTRTFESEALALPPLKMVLVDAENGQERNSSKKKAKQVDKDLNEETVIKIIDKLIAKD